jgi:molecular chaperone GrpE
MEDPGRSSHSLVDPDAAADLDQLRRELEAANQRADEYADLLRQARADFAAHRRQVEAEREAQATQARIDLLLRVLPALEDLQRGLAMPPDDRRTADSTVTLENVERKLREVLESEGMQKIDAMGALYNPWLHEAIQNQASPELEDQRVLAVVRDGYRIGDRVIRPAQVVVARRSR